jgi:hypothetical protein
LDDDIVVIKFEWFISFSCHDNVGVEFEWFASLSLVMIVVLNFNGLFHFLMMIRTLNFEMVCLTLL